MLRYNQRMVLGASCALSWLSAAVIAVFGSGCSDDGDPNGSGSAGVAAMAGSGGRAGSAGVASGGTAGGSMSAGGSEQMAAVPRGDTPNGLALPGDLLEWRVIGAVQRPDDDSLRVIVGNDVAVGAARAGQTDPWPEGSMLAHYVWAGGNNPNNDSVNADFLAPTEFRAVTLMVKGSQEYADDGGWAYGLWRGQDLEPPTDPSFDRACVNCHTMHVSENDYVFTIPGALPQLAAVQGADAAPNGLGLPGGFLDWRVIGAINRADSIRVVVGNEIAVDAARAGQIDPWPEGSMIGHFVWAPGENAASTAALAEAPVAPGSFTALTLMAKDSVDYAADGGWAYGIWNTTALNPPADDDFDRGCVGCHTDNVADNDYVFTVPGDLP